MTDDEIIRLVNDNTEDMWRGEEGVPKSKAIDITRRATEKIRADMKAENDKLVFQLAEKEAKIYAYEAIIANSNFKAVLPRAKEGEK